jgi:hypothetical protein
MASADYYLCDTCGGKTFYDAALSYREHGEPNENPETHHQWPDGNVGDMAVICRECAKTHSIVIHYEPHKAEEGAEE